MKQTYSSKKSALASRKRRLTNPVAVAMDKFYWLQDPKNAEKQQMWQHAWKKQNEAYVREYQRLTNQIVRARKKGDSKLEQKLLIDRRCHCLSLRNRKTPGPMKPL